MKKKIKNKKTLLSFVGSNDAGKLLDNSKGDGAIVTALRNEFFDEVLLLWNENNYFTPTYTNIVKYLKKTIKQLELAKKVSDHRMDILDVTNHNEIYSSIKIFVDELPKENNIEYTASVTSGTPAMQVCWILLGESGEFSEEYPLRLIQVKDPRFGKSKNVEIDLDTTLPKIISLKEEVETLKKDLVPAVTVDVKRGKISIGDIAITLSPIEFCYYRYFAERVLDGLGDEKFSGISVSLKFMSKIFQYHEESFKDLDLNREDLRKMINKKLELGISTFRGNVSKANKKIKTELNNETLSNLFAISVVGGRGAKFYGIKASPDKFIIKKLGQWIMTKTNNLDSTNNYNSLVGNISELLELSRRNSARAVNALLTATYWIIGYRIVEFEQLGSERAVHGKHTLENLSNDLKQRFGKGFSVDNLETMRLFYLTYNKIPNSETVSRNLRIEKSETMSRKLSLENLANVFSLTWSHYVALTRRVKEINAREFYETEALRNGWSVRQLDRQISSQFYERTLLSKNKTKMLKDGSRKKSEDIVSAEDEIKDPFILEFLGLKDEYSENELEESLILHLEKFLLELGSDFAFMGRQKRLRIGNEWYRIDLLFFHRKLRCLVVIDLKVGKFTHADAGQMHMYLNYAKEYWTNKDENPPVGLILCAEKDDTVAKYSLDGLPNKILATEYKLNLPTEKLLVDELKKTQKIIAQRKIN